MKHWWKYGVLLAFAALAVWSGWTLLHPADDGVFLVVLDPGHGDHDPGAVAGEAMEKDINLTVALQVRELLEAQEGVAVVMTREEDEFLSLADRAQLANQEKADLYVSVHANALDDDTFAGIFTFYHPNKPSSQATAKIIQAAVAAASGAIDRGVRSADYVVLRKTNMPAVLVELGFMTCPEELALLVDGSYQKLLAQGIAQGILACRER